MPTVGWSLQTEQFAWPTWFMEWANEEIDLELLGCDQIHPTYAIQCKASGRIKIGISKNPRARRADLQTGSPTPLVLLGELGVSEERAHSELRRYRLHGEWFENAPEVAAYISAHLRGAA